MGFWKIKLFDCSDLLCIADCFVRNRLWDCSFDKASEKQVILILKNGFDMKYRFEKITDCDTKKQISSVRIDLCYV